MANLQSLATELIHRICSLCSLSEIRHLRLVCKIISGIADEYLLPVLELYYCFESVRFAQQLAQSHVARSVRLVCFHADRLNGQSGHYTTDQTPGQQRRNVLSYQDWFAGKNKHSSDAWSMHSMTYPGSPLRIAYFDSRRPECTQISQRLKGDSVSEAEECAAQIRPGWGVSTMMFEGLFRACPCIQDVIVTVGDSLAPTTTFRIQDFTHALAWPKADPDPFRASVHPLNSVLFAVTNTGTKLCMGNLGYHFFLQDPEVLEKFAPTLSSLEKLIIQLETHNLGLRNEDERNLLVEPLCMPANQHIPDLLRQTVNLRDPAGPSKAGSHSRVSWVMQTRPHTGPTFVG
ncbi:hypothetical protein K438DRAFT_2026982 [Mycena galopus ATCC 62051]|nr:hypothetical protein K438DRAFT_2026982 [Mycena galopus ATCC 62051]